MYNSWLFGELYQLGLPLFVPALDLLIRWHVERNLLWETYYWWSTPLIPNSSFTPASRVPHPHEDSPTSWRHWYQFSDYYEQRAAHIQYFDSIDDLFTKLQRADLCAISAAMDAENDKRLRDVTQDWAAVLERMYETSVSVRTHAEEALSYDETLLKDYGLRAEKPGVLDAQSTGNAFARESYAENGYIPRPGHHVGLEPHNGIEDYPVPIEDQCFPRSWAEPEAALAQNAQNRAQLEGHGWWVRHLQTEPLCEFDSEETGRAACRELKFRQGAAEQVALARLAAAIRAPRRLSLVAHDISRGGWMLNRAAVRCAPDWPEPFPPS